VVAGVHSVINEGDFFVTRAFAHTHAHAQHTQSRGIMHVPNAGFRGGGEAEGNDEPQGAVVIAVDGPAGKRELQREGERLCVYVWLGARA